jgi:hypothetical protein
MPSGFQQQQPVRNFGFSKSCATPQHGQPTDKDALKAPEPRSFKPRQPQ